MYIYIYIYNTSIYIYIYDIYIYIYIATLVDSIHDYCTDKNQTCIYIITCIHEDCQDFELCRGNMEKHDKKSDSSDCWESNQMYRRLSE